MPRSCAADPRPAALPAAQPRARRAPVLALLAFIAGCASAGPPPALVAWSEGPARWLLLPAERRELRAVHAGAEAAFLAAFWGRRPPGFERTFDERVAAADQLYSDEDRRGALTERGRALVLLGAPPTLRTLFRSTPTWRPETGRGASPGRSLLRIEVWAYGRDDLSSELVRRLPDDSPELTLRFALEPERTTLLEGDRLLLLAREALASRPVWAP